MTQLNSITLRLLDKYDNIIRTPKEKTSVVLQLKNFSKKSFKVPIQDTEDGYVTFKPDLFKMKEKEDGLPCGIEFKVDQDGQILGLSLERSVVIDKPTTNMVMEMVGLDGSAVQTETVGCGHLLDKY